ncbi:MAG: hypothetical protein MHM6MM_002316 [Cercozoa sp. M6MM]
MTKPGAIKRLATLNGFLAGLFSAVPCSENHLVSFCSWRRNSVKNCLRDGMGECSGKTGLSEETSARMFGVFEEREEQGVGSFVPLETLDFLRERRRQRRCAAHVGIGIRGKEGRQAALAADFVLRDGGFGDLARLVLWHGRLAYWRSARLTQFVMHRGLIIAVMQAVFSALFQFAAVPLFTGWLLVGYSTVYTCLPVFSLVLDEDVDWATVAMFPQLYDEHSAHMRHTPLSLFTFGVWVFKSVYQGCTIMLLSLLLFDDRFLSLVAIAFTVLVLTELMNVALFLQHWTRANVFAEAASLATYLASMFLLKEQFDVVFILSADFWWKVAIITCASCLPVSIGQFLRRKCAPPVHTKLRDRSELV